VWHTNSCSHDDALLRITLRMGLELRSLAQQYIVREAVLLHLVQQVRIAA
jgi:hypothetical protein